MEKVKSGWCREGLVDSVVEKGNIMAKYPIRNIKVVNSFWKGDTLTWVERACIRSFLRHGIKFRLYTYGEVTGIPEGTEVIDANTIHPADDVFVFEGMVESDSQGSPAVFANMFRYLLQKEGAGMWVDCDVYCARPFEIRDTPYIFGRQRPDSINNAVILLPKNCPMLTDLLALFDTPYSIPPWLKGPLHDELVKKHGTTDIHPSFLPWGSTGPRAFTALVEKHGLEEFVRPINVFYPVRLKQIEDMFDPTVDILGDLKPRTFVIHLWNNVIRHRVGETPAKGSFMHQLWLEGQE